ncbi:hypothetical protein ACQEVS_33175 [Streptomyces sp. CA-181903]|uniref:hypothetical protein n=1 Tax=Streptomyces sp. CA-181903 TaxID=3240055 RepID=UPI003D938969
MAAFHGGQGFSLTLDRVDINVDIRPRFDAHDAEPSSARLSPGCPAQRRPR